MDPLNQVRSCHLLCPKERYEKEKEHTKPAKISGQSFQFNYRIVKTSCFNENSNNLHSLFHCSKKEGEEIFYGTCENCHMQIETDTCYFCSYCNRAYHKECVESPSIYHSSDHPKHPLQLLFIKKKKKNPLQLLWSEQYSNSRCFSCQGFCPFPSLLYYCLICDFALHIICSR